MISRALTRALSLHYRRYRQESFVRYDTNVPRHTEDRIRDLCFRAVAAKTPADIDCVLSDLRVALEEHIRLAKVSLGGQVATLATLEQKSEKPKGSTKP